MPVEAQSLEVTYQLTEDDYRHGFQAWRMRTLWRKLSYRLSIAMVTVLSVFGLVLLVWNPSVESRYFSLFALGIPLLWFLGTATLPRIHARSQYRRMPSAHTPITMAVSDSGLNVQSKHYDSRLNWSIYLGWAEGESVFVLFPQPRVYVPIPKRAFSDEQLGRFREILRRNIGKSSTAESGQTSG